LQYGFVFPFADARLAAEFAHDAEQAGWDGFFVWEPVWGIDAWMQLTAAAMRTERIRLGTMITPLSRMRPWEMAGKTVTLDQLSNGRTILAVGLGAVDTGFAQVGEVTERKTRAELLDEGLDIVTGLWHGQPFAYAGKHYRLEPISFPAPPPPVQQPRIPIWVVGAWPRAKSMRRALRYDGLLPNVLTKSGKHRKLRPADVRAIKAYVKANRTEQTPFDIVVEGTTPGANGKQAATEVRKWTHAGATWWLEALWDANGKDGGEARVHKRITQGPPR
jgi:alkanesulfonate monooxygenase SsuD/methylene tetrahydromethanopterin reductase-like flavin-dependent oxidoreductase (luciferase family)